jgi:hypothetical protein
MSQPSLPQFVSKISLPGPVSFTGKQQKLAFFSVWKKGSKRSL